MDRLASQLCWLYEHARKRRGLDWASSQGSLARDAYMYLYPSPDAASALTCVCSLTASRHWPSTVTVCHACSISVLRPARGLRL